ncbi:hypothetical protein E2C01_098278 [Portunus trituberculatus]|uniref:Uncharacterized protein n=1 Tax=Portunus trituberculatus TaxID=210409 RepID=A0A5B7JXF3_PORTR|nr:hypothetical protein [Portunus trituberculatus]
MSHLSYTSTFPSPPPPPHPQALSPWPSPKSFPPECDCRFLGAVLAGCVTAGKDVPGSGVLPLQVLWPQVT